MTRAPRLLAAALLLSAIASTAEAAGRAYRVRTYPLLRSSDSAGDREAATGTFWFAQSDYDNPTGGQIPKVVRLTTGGAVSTWLLDPAAQSFAPTALRRDAARDVTWVLVPLFAESQAALYALAPGSGAVTRTLLPFAATDLQLDAATGDAWVTGTGRIARLSGTALTAFTLENFAGGSSRLDAAGRMWLESDDRTFRSFAVGSGQLAVWADAQNGMRSRDVDAQGRVWAVAENGTRLLRFDPATRVKSSWPLVLSASNWAGVGAGSGDEVHLASSYGPHVLVHVPSAMDGRTDTTLAAPALTTLAGAASTPARTSRTASRTDAAAEVVERLAYAESDAGRVLFSADGIGLSTLLWSDGEELLVGANPVQWWQPVTGPFTTRAVLPAVVEVRPTDPVTNFLTEVTLTNVDAGAAIPLTFRTDAAAYTVTLDVPPGTTRVLPNAVQALRELGAAIPAGASGTLTAAFSNGHGLMTARVYTLFGNDAVFPRGSTTGLGFGSVDPSRKLFVERVTLNGLKATPEFRTNVSVANLCGGLGDCPSLAVTGTFLDDAAGSLLGERDLAVEPGRLGQWNAPLAELDASGETYSVRIQPYGSGYAGYDAYATVISNVVQDAAFIRASAIANSSTPTLPVVTDAAGSGTRFVSEAAITSTTGVTATADVTFTSAVSGQQVSEVLTLEPGRGVRWPNAVDHFRRLAPDKVAANDYGSVRIAFRQFASGFASSRTTATNGTGLAFTAVDPYIERATRRKRIVGLRQGTAYRTNLAVVHLGATTSDASATIDVKVTVTDAQGRAVGSPLTRRLAPGQLFQWNRILEESLGTSGEGFVATIERTAGLDAFEAYATVIDNVSSDSTFLRAE